MKLALAGSVNMIDKDKKAVEEFASKRCDFLEMEGE